MLHLLLLLLAIGVLAYSFIFAIVIPYLISIESEGTTMKIIGKKRVGISLTGVWYCDICNKTYHTTTLANITQKNKKICDKCLDKYKKM